MLPVWLKRAGYRTIHVGKFLNGYAEVRRARLGGRSRLGRSGTACSGTRHYYGYDLFVNGTVQHHGRRRGDHITHVLNRDAVRLVKEYAPKGRPFYLQLDQRAPHVGRQTTPTAAAAGRPSPSRPTGSCSGTSGYRIHRRSTRRT